MLNRLRIALAEGQPIKGVDAIFYTHELAEATKMKTGMLYKAAHEFSLNKYINIKYLPIAFIILKLLSLLINSCQVVLTIIG
jgi:hypothetical protein